MGSLDLWCQQLEGGVSVLDTGTGGGLGPATGVGMEYVPSVNCWEELE